MYCINCGNQINNNSKFCEFCGTRLSSNDAYNNSSDKNNQTIVSHLETAGMLEKRIYEINKIIQDLSYRIERLRIMRKVQKESKNELINFSWLWIFPIAWIIISLCLIFSNEEHPILAILLLYYSTFPFFKKAAIVAAILTAIPLIFNFIINLVNSIMIDLRYKENVRVNEQKYSEALQKAEILENEKRNLLQKREQAELYLEQVYSKNVLYPKYRNMIAVLTILEYFLSGRCDSFVGHEGAYNLYEYELRQNIIINSLEVIQYSLEQIKQNQYMLYQAIKDSQNRLETLSYEFSNISSSIGTLENNSKISAYNSKIAADNSKILAYLEMAK